MKFQKAGGLTQKLLSMQSIVESTVIGSELITEVKSATLLIPLSQTDEVIASGLALGKCGVDVLRSITPIWHSPVTEPPEARGLRVLDRWLKRGGASSMSGIAQSLSMLAGGTEAERHTKIAHRILVTLSQYPDLKHFKGESIERTIAEDWMDALGHFPFYAVERACKAWLSDKTTCKWRPQIGDIKDLAEMYSWQYFKLLRAVKC
jgi:hypothetical protein